MSTLQLNELLTEFCKSIELPEFSPDEANYYSFSVDDSLILEIKYEPDSDLVYFFVQLGFIDEQHKDEIIDAILDANVLWRGTGGVTLGRDSATGVVTLAYQEMITHMSYPRFEGIVETVISNAQEWASRINGDAPERVEAERAENLGSVIQNRV